MVLENIETIRRKILDQLSNYPEDQVREIREQVENATDEELEEFVMSQQNQSHQTQCIFCEIAKGTMNSVKIYEDKDIIAVLEIMPASQGHILVFPKEHKHFIQEVDDKILNKLMNFVKNISPIIIKMLNAEGISIYIPQGQIAGQGIPHFVINIIPRYKEDKEKIVFDWQREKKENEELEIVAEKLKKEAKEYFKQQTSRDNREKEELIVEKKKVIEEKTEENKEEKKIELPKFPRKIPN
ncbi:HIT family protein [Candidatus Pacearchaeota archaeon]|nr:HIT family protein [Candidatus Pacearchaeota archaeon]